VYIEEKGFADQTLATLDAKSKSLPAKHFSDFQKVDAKSQVLDMNR